MTRSARSGSVLIFGGAGFIGSNWAHYLLTNTDANVRIFDNLSRPNVQHNLRWLEKNANNRLQVTIADVRDAKAVHKAVASADQIYHFAAQVAVTTSIDDPRDDFEVNAGGTFNILEAARKSGNDPFLLFTSTNKVYGLLGSARITGSPDRYSFADRFGISESQPLDFHSPYGCSKGTADQYVHDYARIYGLPTVVFRMSCIAGPRQFGNEDQGWVAHFLYSALQDKPISIYGDGRQVRDVLAVQDLVRAFAAVSQNRDKTAGQIYNVGGGPQNTISLLELLESLERLLRKRVHYQFFPTRPGDQPVYVTDFSKLQKHVAWSPRISVQQTVRNIHEWWEQNQACFTPTIFPLHPAKAPLEAMRELAS